MKTIQIFFYNDNIVAIDCDNVTVIERRLFIWKNDEMIGCFNMDQLIGYNDVQTKKVE